LNGSSPRPASGKACPGNHQAGGPGPKSFDLVIFDCDGVLIDSEPIANRVFAQRLATVGIAMSPEEVMRTFVGRSRDTCIAMAGEMRGSPLPPDFAAAWDDALHEALEREVKPVEGVAELLRSLAIPYCVASNGEPSHMQRGLTAAGLMPLVAGRLFSAAQVARPKPAPDVYLHAASAMGHAPARCAVVEDTPTGVKAGIAAAMAVFGYVGGPQSDAGTLRALGATPFARMAELPRLLGIA
jgi:HAD superfamily hydrolase (TIGR01509 family)